MNSTLNRKSCVKCFDGVGHILCGRCEQWMCTKHFNEHREAFSAEMNQIRREHEDLLRICYQENYDTHPLLVRINSWEQQSIAKIRQAANEARTMLKKHLDQIKNQLKLSLAQVTREQQATRDAQNYTEMQVKRWMEQLKELREQLEQPKMIEIQHDQIESHISDVIRLLECKESPQPSASQLFFNYYTCSFFWLLALLPSLSLNARWSAHPVTVAGGQSKGYGLHQLSFPFAIDIDDDGTLYIADYSNHRIVAWKAGATAGQVIAGGNGKGNQIDQLNGPTAVLIDRKTRSLIISDQGNRRVMRWPLQEHTGGQVFLSDICCSGLALDDEHSLYVSDLEKDEVRRYRSGETFGAVVAGGLGRGDYTNQLACPQNIFVDRDQNLYVSDFENHRIMKWAKNAKEGLVVAGGHGQGNELKQLSCPRGLFADALGTVYVIDSGNDRVMRWFKGAQEGTVLYDENAQRKKFKQLYNLLDLSFDREGNLYIVDYLQHSVKRLQME